MLWPFGFGLSFTAFELADLVVVTPRVAPNGTAVMNFTVTNTGARAGWAVPQLYLRRVVASVTTPVLRLKGFARVFLAPQASAAVSLSVDVAAELVVFAGRAMTARVEEGAVTAYVGFSSAAPDLVLQGSFNITAGAALV